MYSSGGVTTPGDLGKKFDYICIYVSESIEILNMPLRMLNISVMRVVEGRIFVLKEMGSTLHRHIFIISIAIAFFPFANKQIHYMDSNTQPSTLGLEKKLIH